MRATKLAQLAVRAEVLRLRALARRQTGRLALAAIAGLFLIAALIAVHVAGGMALARIMEPVWAVLIVAGCDLLIGVVLLVFAARDRPGPVEREALLVRQAAQAELRSMASMASAIGPLLRLLVKRWLSRR